MCSVSDISSNPTTNPDESDDFDPRTLSLKELSVPFAFDQETGEAKAVVKRKARRGSDPKAPKIGAARVHQIALLMTDGQWNKQTAIALAAEWGMELGSVQHYAVRAGELLDLLAGTDDQLCGLMLMTLETIVGKAIKEKKYRDAIEAIRTISGLKGFDKTIQRALRTTCEAVGLEQLLGPAVRAAVLANAAARPGSDDDGGGEG